MMQRSRWTAVVALMLALGLSACGGAGGGVNSTPAAPAALAPPPPAPTPIQAGPLPAPAQTASPSPPVAVVGGTTFDDAVPGTVFPLMITAVESGFRGDPATTEQGAILHAQPRGFTFTLNNVARGFVDVAVTSCCFGSNVIAFPAPGEDLDYTLYGYWILPGSDTQQIRGGGTWLGGYVTLAADIPTSGTASYSGHVTGLAGVGLWPIFGKVELAANFGTRAIDGSITNLAFNDPEVSPIALNDVGFVATLDAAANLLTGTTHPLTVSANPSSAAATGSGVISGRFFGPGASEVGAVWTLSDGTHRMIGSFGAGRTGP